MRCLVGDEGEDRKLILGIELKFKDIKVFR
jgi:hypothetical protein